MPQRNFMHLRHIFLALGCLSLQGAFLTLANWQWQRYQQRKAEVATFQTQPRITLQGILQHNQTVALDNQPNPQNPEIAGWRILTPLLITSQTIIIDRGWASPQPLKNFSTSSTQVTGIFQPFPQRKGWLGGPDTTTSPQQLAFLNPARITSATVGPLYLAATTSTHPSIQPSPQPPFNPQRHLSYMLQWLGLAIAFPILLLTTYLRRTRK